MSTRNKASNKIDRLGGKVKEKVGKVTGNRRTEYEGKLDQAKANVKDTAAKVKDAFR